ncbi:MAG: ATP-binding protein [Anaerolineae bacterium]
MEETTGWLPHPEAMERVVLALRWLALAIVLILSFFDRSTEGVFVPTTYMVLAVAAYNLLTFFLRYPVSWLRRTLNVLTLDAVVATAAVYLTGGFHSSFFIIYFSVVIGAALHLSLVPTILVALIVGLLYVATCFVNPAGVFSLYAAYILPAKVALLLVVALLCALLLEQLRREHQETEREKALAARLSALNDLFQQLTASLDLDHVLQTVVTASCHLLGADVAAISLWEEDRRHLHLAAARGLDTSLLTQERWTADEEPIPTILAEGEPYIFQDVTSLPKPFHPLIERAGVSSGVSVPLILNGTPIGFLDVGHRTPRTYTEEDVVFLNALGQQAALAIRNARLYEAERRQVEQLQALERLQESFVSAVSHELRTPLTCIKTSVGLLQEARVRGATEAQEELLQTIAHHAGRLEALVADLLQITQLEAGQLALTLQPTDVRTIVERAVQSFRPLFEGKGQTIEVNLPETVDKVLVDRRRLEQVLANLLSNAHKFTPKGGWARVALVEREGEVEISVSDNGPGIPPAEQERIFDKFYVVTDQKGLAGVGLGLYIARQLVELHGGRIWVESEPGRGSTFRFTIPKKEFESESADS